jgi:hypothetical protein
MQSNQQPLSSDAGSCTVVMHEQWMSAAVTPQRRCGPLPPSVTTRLQVNAALEELVGHAAACHRQMVLVARNQLTRVAAEDRQRLHELYHGVEVGGESAACRCAVG